jgi:AcrR family transcriptional regulator
VSTVAAPDRAARREALLDAADRIVQRDGPAASMATIAAEAGITKPILYRHFGDKGGLYAALADRYTTRLMADLQAALETAETAVERTTRTIDAYLAAIEAEPQVYRFLVRSAEAVEEGSQVRSFTRRVSAELTVWFSAELGPAAARRAGADPGARRRRHGAGRGGLVAGHPHLPARRAGRGARRPADGERRV